MRRDRSGPRPADTSAAGEGGQNVDPGDHADQSALIVDYRLGPGGNGIQVARDLHRAWGGAVPTLIISGESSEAEIGRIRESGFPLLRKPVPPAKLRSLLAHLLAVEAR